MSSLIDPRFLALIVHDLRNPLNVVGLSVRMIEEVVPKGDPELAEDFDILRENLGQIERMLNCLSDFCRLTDGADAPVPRPFDPRRLLSDVVEEQRSRLSARSGVVLLEQSSDAPCEVVLDPHRARQALQHVLANAVNAAGSGPVHVAARGGPDRWIIEVATEGPTGEPAHSVTLQPQNFERLSGNASERRGLELAVAAAVSRQFGGSARLEVDPARETRIVLDWPARYTRPE
jgi:signal transduction histidine kinase